MHSTRFLSESSTRSKSCLNLCCGEEELPRISTNAFSVSSIPSMMSWIAVCKPRVGRAPIAGTPLFSIALLPIPLKAARVNSALTLAFWEKKYASCTFDVNLLSPSIGLARGHRSVDNQLPDENHYTTDMESLKAHQRSSNAVFGFRELSFVSASSRQAAAMSAWDARSVKNSAWDLPFPQPLAHSASEFPPFVQPAP